MADRHDPPGTASECRSCKALIVWCITEHGKRMPVDVGPTADGDFLIFKRPDHILALSTRSQHPSAVRAAAEPSSPRHRSHFSSCPNAAQHRKPAAKREPGEDG